MQKLPIGIQTFSEIQEENYVYVDKTKYVHKLVTQGKGYFLSRPRRFGKSLLLTTIEELFKGNKGLFKGLYIYDNWPLEEKHPIIHLDFGTRTSINPEELKLYSFLDVFTVTLPTVDKVISMFNPFLYSA